MKRFICLTLLCLLFINVFPINVFAAENKIETIYFDDGSYLVVTLAEIPTRASGTKTGNKTYNYKSSDGELLWKAVLSGTFTYTGTTANCISSSCNISIYNNAWYKISESTGKNGDTAYSDIVMGYKLLGVTMNQIPVSMTLTCDTSGNLS